MKITIQTCYPLSDAEKTEIKDGLGQEEPKQTPEPVPELILNTPAEEKTDAPQKQPESTTPRKKKKLIPVICAAAAVLATVLLIAVPKLTHKQDEYSAARQSAQNYAKYISAGWAHSVALQSDGTVSAAGNNEFGQCYVTGWKDIVAVSAGYTHTIGLKADGTAIANKYMGYNDYDYGQNNVSGWDDIGPAQ